MLWARITHVVYTWSKHWVSSSHGQYSQPRRSRSTIFGLSRIGGTRRRADGAMRGRPSASSSIALPHSASRVAAAAQHESFLRFLAVEQRVFGLPPPRSRSRSSSTVSYLAGDDDLRLSILVSCAAIAASTSAASISTQLSASSALRYFLLVPPGFIVKYASVPTASRARRPSSGPWRVETVLTSHKKIVCFCGTR